MTVSTLMTADELLRLPDDGRRHELVQGELRTMSPTSYGHGHVQSLLVHRLLTFLESHRLGDAVTEVGFRLRRNPDTVRGPDVAFIRPERSPEKERFVEGAPDIAFEVVSPGDTYAEIEEKTRDYLRAGTLAVVVINPRTQSARIHRTTGVEDVRDALALPDLLPGWSLPLSELFA